jgi:hypothetical protein
MLSSSQDTLALLRDQLERARRSIIHLMPREAQNILWTHEHCKSKADTWRWAEITAMEIIELATPLPVGPSQDTERAYCPLCGGSALDRYKRGFDLTAGLLAHLRGWAGEYDQCSVFNAAERLAREFWKESFCEEAESATALKWRRISETLYNVGPYEPIRTIEEEIYFEISRNEDEMAWAEDRLRQLGIETIFEGNIKSHIIESETFVVYADPREIGTISFGVYMKTSPLRQSNHEANFFSFSDRFRNNICRIFESRLLKACGEPNDPYFLQGEPVGPTG